MLPRICKPTKKKGSSPLQLQGYLQTKVDDLKVAPIFSTQTRAKPSVICQNAVTETLETWHIFKRQDVMNGPAADTPQAKPSTPASQREVEDKDPHRTEHTLLLLIKKRFYSFRAIHTRPLMCAQTRFNARGQLYAQYHRDVLSVNREVVSL